MIYILKGQFRFLSDVDVAFDCNTQLKVANTVLDTHFAKEGLPQNYIIFSILWNSK